MKKYLKMVMLVSLIVVTVAGGVFAEGTDELVSQLMLDYNSDQGHFTMGLDFMFIGSIQRDEAFGYPQSGFGMNAGLGFVWRKYYGQPSNSRVRSIAQTILHSQPNLDYFTLREQVKGELHKHVFPFFGVNSILFVIPGIEGGLTIQPGQHVNINLSAVWGLDTLLIPLPMIGVQVSF